MATTTSCTPPPPSGHQNASNSELEEALTLFLDPTLYRWTSTGCTQTSGGVNNVTKIVQATGVSCGCTVPFVLRIYRNNNHTGRVAWEHIVLKHLQKVADQDLSFSFPTPIVSLTGNTYEVLGSGAACCVFKHLPGELAKTADPAAVGAAAGATSALLAVITSSALADLDARSTDGGPSRRDLPAPYHQLWAVHHAVTSRQVFLHLINAHKSEWFSQCSAECVEAFDVLVLKLIALDDGMKADTHDDANNEDDAVDHQHTIHLIHGDLHYDNVLMSMPNNSDSASVVGTSVQPHRVTAVLDFEFVSLEWRIMELAICLSKYLSEAEEDILPIFCAPFIDAFVAAYARQLDMSVVDKSTVEVPPSLPKRTFTPFEISHFVDCIALRILSNVVFFVGRAATGEDVVEGLTSRVIPYRRRLDWLQRNGHALEQLLSDACAKYAGAHM